MSKRIKRVNQLIKQEISQILLREIDSLKNTLVTVTRAETTPDLRESKIFLSVIPDENTNKIIKFLNRNIYRLQQKINKRLHMKPVPKIKFVQDKITKEAERIERILEQLKKKEE
ncbi:MAG: 30S ribosome-binding factor RbfA [Candidatus Nealsonbacteria bacterium]